MKLKQHELDKQDIYLHSLDYADDYCERTLYHEEFCFCMLRRTQIIEELVKLDILSESDLWMDI